MEMPPPPPPPSPPLPRIAASMLSFVAGYVDTLGFVALAGLFTAHVTGNFVLIGSELMHPSQGMLLKWLAFPAFVLGVAAARLLALRLPGARPMLALQGLLLAVASLAGAATHPELHPQGLASLAAGTAMAAAMGVQNAAGRLAWSTLSPTTVMTGNVTQLVLDGVDMLRTRSAEARERIAKLAWPIATFALGAAGGAFAFDALGFWALGVPMLVLAGVASKG